jgi:hypothetical protein
MISNDEFGQANTVVDLVAAYFPNFAPSDKAAPFTRRNDERRI